MSGREPLVLGGLVALLLVAWLGFFVHTAPRFAGSIWGVGLGVAGGLLMVAPLGYSIIKRIPRRWRTRNGSPSTQVALDWHVYTGLAGAVFGLLHSGHQFGSPLGIALTATSLVVALSGYVGRQLMKRVSMEVRDKRRVLTGLELAYRRTAGELAAHPEQAELLRSLLPFGPRLFAFAGRKGIASGAWSGLPAGTRALRLSDAISDVEYDIAAHEALKRRFAIWLDVHVVAGVLLYVLLALHVWAAFRFGLRWWP